MAAPILSYEDLGLIQGEGWLFRGLDLYVGERDRLALIGRNGAGKTTLLKCLADLIDPDEGKRTIVPGTHVVLLEQDPKMDGFETLQQWVLHGRDAPENRFSQSSSHSIAARSKWLVGSSSNSTSGLCASARVIAARRRSPPLAVAVGRDRSIPSWSAIAAAS